MCVGLHVPALLYRRRYIGLGPTDWLTTITGSLRAGPGCALRAGGNSQPQAPCLAHCLTGSLRAGPGSAPAAGQTTDAGTSDLLVYAKLLYKSQRAGSRWRGGCRSPLL